MKSEQNPQGFLFASYLPRRNQPVSYQEKADFKDVEDVMQRKKH